MNLNLNLSSQAFTSSLRKSQQPGPHQHSELPIFYQHVVGKQSSTSSVGNQDLVAYVHNVTPVLSSTSMGGKPAVGKYREMQLQTKDDIQARCLLFTCKAIRIPVW